LQLLDIILYFPTGLIKGFEDKESLTPESSALEAMTKLLNGLYQLQMQTNQTRAQGGLEPITVIARTVDTNSDGNPVVNLGISLEIDLNASLNNLIDPTVEG
jgi:hypothetical protein